MNLLPSRVALLLAAVALLVAGGAFAAAPSCPDELEHLGHHDQAEDESKAEPAEGEEDSEDDEWDVSESHGPTVEIEFTTSEGTWMTADVSPDGKTIVFDHIGDLFTIGVGGGTATRLTSGLAWDYQPRFSPDGTEILFTSDRAGGNNLRGIVGRHA